MVKLNDKWLRIVGVPLIPVFSTFVLFSFLHDQGNSWLRIYLIILIFTVLIWEADRQSLIRIRRKLPGTQNLLRRSLAQLLVNLTVPIILLGLLLPLLDALHYWKQPFTFHLYVYAYFIIVPVELVITVLYELIYYFDQWSISFMLSESLKKENLQVQFDSLKNKVNPHFLFNSLNELSYLIDEKPNVAKEYLDELAVVYRNILESNEKELHTLEEELEFLRAYFYLLHRRFGTHLHEEISVAEKYLDWKIPPLTLQILIENAVKHNIISELKPLAIKIYSADNDVLVVSNNLQKINYNVHSNKIGLENIKSKYRLLNQPDVVVNETEGNFEVILPLIKYE